MENLRAQAERFGAELVPDDVVSVQLPARSRRSSTRSGAATTTARAR